MKKGIITFLASALITPCFAEEVPSLLIKTAETEQAVVLADIDKVTYTDTDMNIAMKDGNSRSFLMDDILEMVFTGTSSINMTPTEANENEIIYTLDGIQVNNTDKKGIYIIKVGKETRKIAK